MDGQTRGTDYEDSARPEMLRFIPPAATILDVGCWRGAFGAALKRRDIGSAVWGIESVPDAAANAAERLDRVLVGEYPQVLEAEAPHERFDCISFLDVLEHMVDPWTALHAARSHLEPGGKVVASIPNVRNLQVLAPLMRGRWDYADSGILDRTHLRFFTRRTIVDMFETAGFTIERLEAINLITRGRLARAATVLGRRGIDFRALQFAVVGSVSG